MRFDWTDLQLFVHACESGSLTGAASRGHLTLAAVSARMREMEADCGAPLLERHARGVRPTAAGQALLHHARAVLDQMAQLRAELAQHGRAQGAALRLLVNTSALVQTVGPPLARFLAAQPACSVQVEESTSHLSVQALRQGLADLAIVSDAVDTTGLHTRLLGKDPLLLVLPRGHALAAQRSVAFEDALAFDWIGYGAASALQAHLAMQAAARGRLLRVRASLDHFDAVHQLVSHGAGVAIMPAAVARRPPAGCAVVTRPLREPWSRRSLLLCARGGPPVAPLVGALMECFIAAPAPSRGPPRRRVSSPVS